eukprot:scaffold13736_cov21-Tisochrysis_lutea.AAC.2
MLTAAAVPIPGQGGSRVQHTLRMLVPWLLTLHSTPAQQLVCCEHPSAEGATEGSEQLLAFEAGRLPMMCPYMPWSYQATIGAHALFSHSWQGTLGCLLVTCFGACRSEQLLELAGHHGVLTPVFGASRPSFICSSLSWCAQVRAAVGAGRPPWGGVVLRCVVLWGLRHH